MNINMMTEEMKGEGIKEEIVEKRQLTTKDELVSNIKEWIKMDNEILKLKSELKEKTKRKKGITEALVKVMKNNAIDCFDIHDGSLIYKKKKTKRTISGKFLLQQLEEYYKDQPDLAKEITKHVLDNRVEVVKEDINIKRK